MPLYMDVHSVDSDSFSVEDVVKAHMEDLAIQEQFGVTQLKYWVNVEAKTLFCLMKGPSIEACVEVHKQSHGNTACNIIEVSDDEFNLFLGKGNQKDDLAQTLSGEIDTGYRTLLCITLEFTKSHQHCVTKAYQIIEQHEGVIIRQPQEEIMASFIYASSAIQSALHIRNSLKALPDNIEYRIALASGSPVDEKGNTLFEVTKKKTQFLCTAGVKNTIYLDHETYLLAGKEKISPTLSPSDCKIIQAEDFNLLSGIFELFHKHLNSADFTSKNLHPALAWSKSQLYRKLKSLTGMAPNQFIQEIRLRQSLKRLRRGDQTIAEVAYNSGFNSPTYFTKVFRQRFGISPKSFA